MTSEPAQLQARDSSGPGTFGNVTRPQYDRQTLTPGIVHIGVGNFHRAHQAVYLDRLFASGVDHDWAIVGAGVRPQDAITREKLEKQDWLTTVVELDPEGLTARISGAMIDYVPVGSVATGHQPLVAVLAKPEIRIVSLTITEGGYYIDAKTGGFQIDNPDIVHDIENPDRPATVFGIIVAALAARRAHNRTAFTVMSCDNIPENGEAARSAIVGLANAISADLGTWIGSHAAFPNGMVDCITPVTSDGTRALVQERFGIEDACPVTCEPYRQWVLEDRFSAGRPALEKVGVQFVAEVAPYELMKLRILNGGHAAIAYPAALMGFGFVHEAMADPVIRGFLQKLEGEEIIPMVPPIEGVDLGSYFAQVQQRFSNSAVADTVSRLCLDGSNRQPKFILPIIADRLQAGLPIAGLALELALWCRYCMGTDEQGRALDVEDENVDLLKERALAARDNPGVFLDLESVFGTLGRNMIFRRDFAMALTGILSNGVRQTLVDYQQG